MEIWVAINISKEKKNYPNRCQRHENHQDKGENDHVEGMRH